MSLLPAVVLDFETYYDKEYTLKKMTSEQYVRDPRFHVHGVGVLETDTLNAHWMSGPNIPAFLQSLQLDKRPVIMHHAQFDGLILSEWYKIFPAFFVDTLSMARALGEQHLSLGKLAEKYCLGVKNVERLMNVMGVRDLTPQQERELGEYCIGDVRLTNMLFVALRERFPRAELPTVDNVIKMYTRPLLRIDGDLARATSDSDTYRTANLLLSLGLHETQLASNEQFAEALRTLGVDPPMKVSLTTNLQTFAFAKSDKEFMELLEHDDERVSALVAARLGVKSTITRTRAENLAGVAKRGAWPVYLRFSGARQTHRLSGGEKLNPQNFTRGSLLRKAVCAPPPDKQHPDGYVLVACDSSNIELRVNMYLAQQNDVLEMLRRGVDLYCDFASTRFGRVITKADERERQYGKICHLALGYGMGWEKFVDTARLQAKMAVDEGDARATVGLYRQRFAKVPEFWRRGEEALKAIAVGEYMHVDPGGLVTTLFGALVKPAGIPLWYNDLHQIRTAKGMSWVFSAVDDKTGRTYEKYIYGGKLVENIVQSMARDIVMEQMNAIARKYPVVMQVHDEVVAVVPAIEAEAAKAFMVKVMSTAPTWMPDIPLAAEAFYSYRYGDC